MNDKQYNNNIKKIVKLMSMESKINIVGFADFKEFKFSFQNQFMASTEPFALKSPHVWLFFDDAMGKAIHGSQGALEPANFIFLFMYENPCVLQRFAPP